MTFAMNPGELPSVAHIKSSCEGDVKLRLSILKSFVSWCRGLNCILNTYSLSISLFCLFLGDSERTIGNRRGSRSPAFFIGFGI